MQTPNYMARMGHPEALPEIVLNLTPHEVMRALESLRYGRWYVAGRVASMLEDAAPAHMAILHQGGPS